MKIKEGVTLNGLKIEMRKVLIIAEKIWMDKGQELVITSATEGTHNAGSYHPFGYAVDFRTRYFDKPTKLSVFADLTKLLDPVEYSVVQEETHIHVQYNALLMKRVKLSRLTEKLIEVLED